MEYNRKIKTNLEATNKNYEILDSVHGQMSDGIWENSPVMENYWVFSNIEVSDDNKIVIVVSDTYQVESVGFTRKKFARNGFKFKTDDQVKAFFANKIKQIVAKEGSYEDAGDYSWRKDNQQKCGYMGYKETITVADAYAAYKNLKTSI